MGLYQHLHLRLLTSRITKYYICIVFSHETCGNLFQQQQEANIPYAFLANCGNVSKLMSSSWGRTKDRKELNFMLSLGTLRSHCVLVPGAYIPGVLLDPDLRKPWLSEVSFFIQEHLTQFQQMPLLFKVNQWFFDLQSMILTDTFHSVSYLTWLQQYHWWTVLWQIYFPRARHCARH